MSRSFQNGHEIWGSVAGDTLHGIGRQIETLVQWGVHAIEFRFDLIPKKLWSLLAREMELPVEWWVVHFGTGMETAAAHEAVELAANSQASGCALHSRCEGLVAARQACSDAGIAFAAPFHSQQPLSEEAALSEYEYQAQLDPHFRKIAVRADNVLAAMSIIRATARAVSAARSPIVGAVFGSQRWARVALPQAGSAITFVTAPRDLTTGSQAEYQQLDLPEVEALLRIREFLPSCRPRTLRRDWRWTLALPERCAS